MFEVYHKIIKSEFRYFIYLLLSFILLSRVGEGYLWHTDTLYFFNPESFFVWGENLLGESLVGSITFFPFKAIILLLNLILDNNILVSKMLYFFSFFSLMISIDYIFSKIFYNDKRDEFTNKLIILSVCIFSIANPLIIEYSIIGCYVIFYLISIFLWQFYFFYKLLKTEEYRYLIYSIMLNLFLVHLVIGIIFQAILIFWLIYKCMLKRKLGENLLRYVLSYFLLTTLLLSFFVIPVSNQIFSSDVISSIFKGNSDEIILNSYAPHQKILNYLTLQSYYDLAYIIYYSDFIFILFLLIVLIIFSGFIFRDAKYKDLKLFWGSIIF